MAEKTDHSPATSLLSIKLLPYSQEFFFPFALFSRFFDSGPEKIAPNELRDPNQNTGNIGAGTVFPPGYDTRKKALLAKLIASRALYVGWGKRYLPLYSQFANKPANAALASTGKLKGQGIGLRAMPCPLMFPCAARTARSVIAPLRARNSFRRGIQPQRLQRSSRPE